jgi:hypothetical protein
VPSACSYLPPGHPLIALLKTIDRRLGKQPAIRNRLQSEVLLNLEQPVKGVTPSSHPDCFPHQCESAARAQQSSNITRVDTYGTTSHMLCTPADWAVDPECITAPWLHARGPAPPNPAHLGLPPHNRSDNFNAGEMVRYMPLLRTRMPEPLQLLSTRRCACTGHVATCRGSTKLHLFVL